MIEAKELRIGNWVKHNDIVSSSEYPDTIFQWTESHWHDIVTSHLSLNSIDPIPLTPDILLACGFEVNEFGCRVLDKWFEIYWDGMKSFQFNYEHNEEYYIKEIHYLHQLQNLYHSLTGKELEIKL